MNYLTIILVLISFIAFKIYQKTRVPEGLKNVPTLNTLTFALALFGNLGPDKRWETFREYLEKDGIVKVWFNGRWSLLVTDLELAKDVMTKTELYPKILLDESFPGSLINTYYGINVALSNGDIWKRHRRVINPAFRNLPMHVFVEGAMKLLEVMEKIDNEPIKVNGLTQRLTLDVLGKASFDFDFNNLKDPQNVYVTTYNEVIYELGNPLYFIFPFLERIISRTGTIRKMTKFNHLLDGLVEKKIKSVKTGELSKKIDNNSADLLDCMVQASNDPENPTLTSEELRRNLAVFMLAGHDTTAKSLTSVLYLLATHKDVQRKVRDEILRVLGDDLTPSMEQQKDLKYMNMVIHENLRLYPPALQLGPRRPLHDIKIRNHVIPAHTPINVYVYGIHHSSKYWENPEEFIPERFEKEQPAFSVFGGGARICLGINFSLIEQRVMLCLLLRKYEVSLPANSIHKGKLQLTRDNTGTIGILPVNLTFKRRTE